MATRNIVPRNNEEGNIGTAIKNWLKGWFKDIFISGVLTDGVNSVTLSQLVAVVADEHHDNVEAESTTTSQVYIQKARLSFTPQYTSDYVVLSYCECGNTGGGKSAQVRLEQDDTTELGSGIAYSDGAGDYIAVNIAKVVPLTAGVPVTFDLDYRATSSTAQIRRARISIRKKAGAIV
jgi:hypothetical protein